MASKNYSGKFVVRVDPIVHKKLVLAGRTKDESLNKTVKALLEAGLKKYEQKFGELVS